MRDLKIMFYGSDKFPVPTFKYLVENKDNSLSFDVVGLVTTKPIGKKKVDGEETLIDIAEKHGIKVFYDHNSDEFMEYIKDLYIDYNVVISYKKLPQEIIKRAVHSFNVHASILPFLRGAAPINWALRLGFEKTGLTSFLLSDKIDCGHIIHQEVCDIKEDDNFGSLYDRLSQQCVGMTMETLYRLFKGMYNAIPNEDCGIKSEIFKAPKINADYFKFRDSGDVLKTLRSLAPYHGIKCHIAVDKMFYNKKSPIKNPWQWRRLETIDCTIWNAGIMGKEVSAPKLIDCRTSMGSLNMSDLIQRGYTDAFDNLDVREIQIAGKKRMGIGEFLRGFKYTRDEYYGKYCFYIELDKKY